MRQTDLEEILYKYERLQSLIGIMQMFVVEVVDIVGEPNNYLTNALYEIEIEMDKNNKRLKGFIREKGNLSE